MLFSLTCFLSNDKVKEVIFHLVQGALIFHIIIQQVYFLFELQCLPINSLIKEKYSE